MMTGVQANILTDIQTDRAVRVYAPIIRGGGGIKVPKLLFVPWFNLCKCVCKYIFFSLNTTILFYNQSFG